jgi:hypothetical protein
MNTKNFWIAAAAGGALSLLVTNLPYIGFVNCLLCAGFWGSAIFAVWLYRRLNGSISVREAVKVGAMSGLIGGVVGLLLSFLGLAGVQGMMNGLKGILPAEDLQGMEEIPAWAGWLVNVVGVIIEIGFGALGGWIGAALFRTDRVPQNPTSNPGEK